MTDTKWCLRCESNKPLDDFSSAPSQPSGRHGYCKSCQCVYNNAWSKRNPKKTAVTDRRKSLKKYNLTVEDYELLLEYQHGKCAVCGRKPTKSRRLAVDHEHKSGLVRGLICATRCNYQLLGAFHDDAALFRGAADYLDNPPAPNILVRYAQNAPPRKEKKS